MAPLTCQGDVSPGRLTRLCLRSAKKSELSQRDFKLVLEERFWLVASEDLTVLGTDAVPAGLDLQRCPAWQTSHLWSVPGLDTPQKISKSFERVRHGQPHTHTAMTVLL